MRDLWEQDAKENHENIWTTDSRSVQAGFCEKMNTDEKMTATYINKHIIIDEVTMHFSVSAWIYLFIYLFIYSFIHAKSLQRLF